MLRFLGLKKADAKPKRKHSSGSSSSGYPTESDESSEKAGDADDFISPEVAPVKPPTTFVSSPEPKAPEKAPSPRAAGAASKKLSRGPSRRDMGSKRAPALQLGPGPLEPMETLALPETGGMSRGGSERSFGSATSLGSLRDFNLGSFRGEPTASFRADRGKEGGELVGGKLLERKDSTMSLPGAPPDDDEGGAAGDSLLLTREHLSVHTAQAGMALPPDPEPAPAGLSPSSQDGRAQSQTEGSIQDIQEAVVLPPSDPPPAPEGSLPPTPSEGGGWDLQEQGSDPKLLDPPVRTSSARSVQAWPEPSQQAGGPAHVLPRPTYLPPSSEEEMSETSEGSEDSWFGEQGPPTKRKKGKKSASGSWRGTPRGASWLRQSSSRRGTGILPSRTPEPGQTPERVSPGGSSGKWMSGEVSKAVSREDVAARNVGMNADERRYFNYVIRKEQEGEIEALEQKERDKKARKVRLAKAAAAAFLALALLIAVIAGPLSVPEVVVLFTGCAPGYWYGKLPTDSFIELPECQRCPASSYSRARSGDVGDCFCNGGFYGAIENVSSACTPCDRGLWAPTRLSTQRVTCLPVQAYWKIGRVGQTCEDACGEENKTSDQDGLRILDSNVAAVGMMEILDFNLRANCTSIHASFRSVGPFICSEPECGPLRGACFYPAPPILEDSEMSTPSIMRRFCACHDPEFNVPVNNRTNSSNSSGA